MSKPLESVIDMVGWAIIDEAKTRFHYISKSRESAEKWLRFRMANKPRGKKYAGLLLVRVEAATEFDAPSALSRNEMTGDQLRASYECSKEAA